MAKCRPSKWVPWAFLGAGLPLFAAGVYELSSHKMRDDISTRASSALSADETTAWAKVESNGRDFVLQGTAPSQEAVDKAVMAVAGTYGVRTLSTTTQIVEPVKLVAPTVESVNATSATPEIKGTWQEGVAKTLAVTVAGTTYKLGENPELTTLAGEWTLKPTTLPEGAYDVTVESSDGKVAMAAAAPGKLVVDLPDPAPEPAPETPKVEADVTPPPPLELVPLAAGAVWPYAITGKWAEEAGSSLKASVAGRNYTVNSGAALSSDGKGNFTFQPSAKLAPGSYDIDFTMNDAAGNVTTQTLKAAIVVPEPAAAKVVEPEPTPAPAPIVVAATPATVAATAADAKWPYAITGTWDEKPGHSLTASVAGRNYVLGRGAALTSDGAGKFTFAPSAKFAPGTYDVVFTTNDATSESKLTVAKAAIVIPEPPAAPAPAPAPRPKLPSPTVVSQLDLTGAPLIKGTWPHDKATVLAVNVGGRNYVLGKDANLSAKDGNWTLFPGTALADGVYDVKVGVSNAEGVLGKDETKDELEVDGTPPAAPTVMTMSGDVSPDHLSGTWDQAAAKGLTVTVPQVNLTAVLGAAGSPLTSDGAGKWRLELATPLPAGTYNIVAETTDVRGRVQNDVSEGEVVVVAAGQPVPVVVPYDCAATMKRIGNVFPDSL